MVLMVDQAATVVVPLMPMEVVDLVATAEVMEEAMETHPDREANPPGGRSYPGGLTAPPWASRLVDAARGGTFCQPRWYLLTLPLASHPH